MRFDLEFRARRGQFELQAQASTEGHRVGLFGPSGSGKTSLIRAVAGLDPATGRLQLGDEVWLDTRRSLCVPTHRRRVGWVPQQSALVAGTTVRRNLELAASLSAAWAGEVIATLGLSGLLDRRAAGLSGGEQKRVALARALLAQPRVLLLDEPLAGLDWPRRDELLTYLLRVLGQFDVPAVYVSHDPFEIGVFCETVWLMKAGRITSTGTPEQVFLHPENRFQGLLAGIENRWRGVIEAVDSGLARIRIEGHELYAECATGEAGDRVVVVLAAAEVLLAREVSAQTSARNIWPVRVEDMAVRGREVAVHLSSGDPSASALHVTAIITPAALSELELTSGERIFAVFKATAARIFAA